MEIKTKQVLEVSQGSLLSNFTADYSLISRSVRSFGSVEFAKMAFVRMIHQQKHPRIMEGDSVCSACHLSCSA